MKTFIGVIALLLILAGCRKNLSEGISAPISALENVKVKNGRLHFPSKELFYNTEEAINSKEPLDLSEWHQQLGFCSMKKLHNEVQEDFSIVKNMEAYRNFLTKHQSYLYITPDSSISINGYQPFLSQILNIDGEVYIGDALVKYTNTHIVHIADGSETKLAQALQNLLTDEKQGIVVKLLPQSTRTLANARSCDRIEVWHTCFAWGGVWHRIMGHYYIDNDPGTISSGTIAGNYVYDLTSTLRCQVLSEYEGFLGFWYRKRTTITWNIGWGAFCPDTMQSPYIAHGTGWTVSNVSEINYLYRIRPNWITVRWDQIANYSYEFDYFSSNLQTPMINCSEWCS